LFLFLLRSIGWLVFVAVVFLIGSTIALIVVRIPIPVFRRFLRFLNFFGALLLISIPFGSLFYLANGVSDFLELAYADPGTIVKAKYFVGPFKYLRHLGAAEGFHIEFRVHGLQDLD